MIRPEYAQGWFDALVEMCVLKYDVSSGFYSDFSGNIFRIENAALNINDKKKIPYDDIISFNVYEGTLNVEHWEKRSVTN